MGLGLPETVSHFVIIPLIIFLIFLLPPLYKLAADRTAIYIVFSKTCLNIVYLCLTTPFDTLTYFIVLPPLARRIYSYFMQAVFFATFVHFLAMAINRFHAVFLPFSYLRIWKKKITQIYIFFVTILGLFLGFAFVFTYVDSSWLLNSVQFTVLGGCGAIYSAMMVKFTHELFMNKTRGQNAPSANLEKDRILLSFIALLSVLPLPISLIVSPLQGVYAGSLAGTILTCFRIFNYALMQCIEEFCLIIFCKDFRVLVRKQLKFIWPEGTSKDGSTTQITAMSIRTGDEEKVNPQKGSKTTKRAWQNGEEMRRNGY